MTCPVTFKVVPSNFKFDSHVKVFASPPTFVIIELLVAFETRGMLIMSAPSDVLKLPETMLPTTKLPGMYS